MLNHLKKLLQNATASAPKPLELEFNTALAALMIEVMRSDGKTLESELNKIRNILISRCQLEGEQVETLLEQAQQQVDQAIDLYAFVKQINRQTSDVERIEIIELLWHVAFADGHLDSHEDHIIRKISGLLYVAHVDFIAAKIAAQDALPD
ncbi:TerB family tellurite resistance protein [Pseudoalteromonas sp. MMG022]|uniref:tellurite resistance TerB family protein n=1 Tax=Pseudoalteromonas sp. MMG022 TaxID=2909978 RepID=UPI001F226E1A|nr:TerB family tellurite resistance protein [Pseudoalteromonas sp. MMG022]MCF6437372.1 TerB family tellurite resistance protein [Pseudoalteromonas sp. MMG022]